MSGAQPDSELKIHKLPLIIKKKSLKSVPTSSYGVFRCVGGKSKNFIKEDIIYNAKDNDFLKGKYPNLVILNRFDMMKSSSRTTATYDSGNSSEIRLSSDAVVNIIGQENYDQVLTALCSVISQELKVKGILSLLSNVSSTKNKNCFNVETQTYESSYNEFIKDKQRRNKRKKIKSYVAKDHPPKRLIILPCNSNLVKSEKIKVEIDEHSNSQDCLVSDTNLKTDETGEKFTEVNCDNNGDEIVTLNLTSLENPKLHGSDDELFHNFCISDDTNISDVGSTGNLSIGSNFSLSNIECNANSVINYIDEHIEETKSQHNEYKSDIAFSTSMGGSIFTETGIPFHLATSNSIKHLMPDEQKQFILRQALIEWKFCLHRDEDGNLPIHLAVLNNNVDLLKRQCIVLKMRNESIDIPAPGNLTALQMSILQDYSYCTTLLLAQGADLLVRDDELRTTLHLAAEIGPKHVEALLAHCKKNPRQILQEDDDLWNPELENKSDSKLAEYLITKLCMTCDNQGYTPLMLASKVGNSEVVRLLVQAAPNSINMAMPTCGNTALYLAVGTACIEATNRGDKTKVPENYEKTIEILVVNGADPALDNNYGTNVNQLLSEFNIVQLSLLIANKLTAIKYFHGDSSKDFGSYMLIKDEDGQVNLTEMSKFKGARRCSYAKQLFTNQMKLLAEPKGDINDYNNKKILNNVTMDKTNKNVTQPVENIEHKCCCIDNEPEKPVILKNIPVVTKIVSFENDEKPIRVQGIVPNPGANNADNKGLKTPIKKISPKRCNNDVTRTLTPLPTPKYLKILPKPIMETNASKILPKPSLLVKKVHKILPKADLSVKDNIPKYTINISKKHPIILRNVPVKRSKSDNDNSIPGTSKKPKS